MSIFKRIFGRKDYDSASLVEDSAATKAPTSPERDSFYKDLAAQLAERGYRLALVGEEEDQSAKLSGEAMAKVIMPRTCNDFRVVQTGDAPLAAPPAVPEGMEVAQDAAPAGAVQSGLTPAQGNMVRNVDLYQIYGRINPRILRHFVSRAFIGYPACTLLGQHEIIGLCCSIPAEDAIAPGFSIVCNSQVHKQDDNHVEAETKWIEQLHDFAVDSGVEDLCVKFGTYKRLYGIAIAIPRVRLKEGHTFQEPYDPSLIEPGSFTGFTVIDPARVTWDFDANTLFDPLSEWYQKPEFLRLLTVMTDAGSNLGEERRMHRSWVVTANYREVGEDLLATYMYGGQPLSQLLYERVFAADTLANEIVSLAMSKRCVVMDGNKSQMMMEPTKVELFLRRLNYFRTNNSVLLKEPGMNVTQLDTSLADLQPLSAQQYQYAAAIAGIPVTKLLKNVPSGLQATGQYEVEDYEETIKPIRQDNKMLLNRWFEMYIASAHPERSDLSVKVKFNPFVTPKAAEQQQIASQKSSMVCQLMMNGVVTVAEARAILKLGEDDVFDILSAATPELLVKIQKAKDPEEQQKMQLAMQSSMNGGRSGAGAIPGAGGAATPPPEPQVFAQNKGVFESVLSEVMKDAGDGKGGVFGDALRKELGAASATEPAPAPAPESAPEEPSFASAMQSIGEGLASAQP